MHARMLSCKDAGAYILRRSARASALSRSRVSRSCHLATFATSGPPDTDRPAGAVPGLAGGMLPADMWPSQATDCACRWRARWFCGLPRPWFRLCLCWKWCCKSQMAWSRPSRWPRGPIPRSSCKDMSRASCVRSGTVHARLLAVRPHGQGLQLHHFLAQIGAELIFTGKGNAGPGLLTLCPDGQGVPSLGISGSPALTSAGNSLWPLCTRLRRCAWGCKL